MAEDSLVTHPHITRTVLITGFLGAGKTTFLNRLIEHYTEAGLDIAVLVNEFGSIGIDGALVIEGDFPKIELNKGSIFCICMRTDFISEVKRIAEEIRPDILLVEATGIARVDDLYAMMSMNDLDRLLSIEKNICVADATSFFKVEKTLEAVRVQIRYADLIILNKGDAADTEQLRRSEEAVRRHNPKAPVVRAVRGKITWDIYELAAPIEKEAPAEVSDTVPEDFYSFSLRLPGAIRRDCWKELVEELKGDILRGKGIIQYPGERRFFEVVNHEYTEYPPPPGLAGEEENVIVLIRGTIGEGSLAERIRECLVESGG